MRREKSIKSEVLEGGGWGWIFRGAIFRWQNIRQPIFWCCPTRIHWYSELLGNFAIIRCLDGCCEQQQQRGLRHHRRTKAIYVTFSLALSPSFFRGSFSVSVSPALWIVAPSSGLLILLLSVLRSGLVCVLVLTFFFLVLLQSIAFYIFILFYFILFCFVSFFYFALLCGWSDFSRIL